MAKRKPHSGRSKYDDLKETAVHAVITSRSDAEAARVVGIAASTLKKWKARPDFKEALAAKRETVAASADEAIRSYCEKVFQFGPEALIAAREIMHGAAIVTKDGDVIGDNAARIAAARLLAGEFSRLMGYVQTERKNDMLHAILDRLGIPRPESKIPVTL